jgi:hypothetical protein
MYMKCPSCSALLETGFAGIGKAKYAEEYQASAGES